MNKLWIVIIVTLVFSNDSKSQELPQFSMFWNNLSIYNPAATGINGKHFGSFNYKNQWLGFEGAPQDYSALYELRLDSIHSAFGINIINSGDRRFRNFQTNLNYGYTFNLSNDKKLILGTAVSIMRYSIDLSGANAIDVVATDNPISNTNLSRNSINSDVGFLFNAKKFSLGVSAANIFNTYKNPYTDSVKHFIISPDIYVNADYKLNILPNFELHPALFFTSNLTNSSINLNLKSIIKNSFWFGMNLSTAKNFGVFTGINIKQHYTIGALFSSRLNRFRSYNSGDLEVVLAIKFP
jgi:type IX secretion system PorP/SprF family membrane protein